VKSVATPLNPADEKFFRRFHTAIVLVSADLGRILPGRFVGLAARKS
jgi:hypothetical protein